MAKNENELTEHQEAHFKNLFSKLANINIEPTPFLMSSVLARTLESKQMKKKVVHWQLLSASMLSAVIFMGWYNVNLSKQLEQDGRIQQSYVIHVDFDQNDLSRVARAEVRLPDDVHFVSSKPEVRSQRQLKLPVQVSGTGRGKLPFVVTSETIGEKKIFIRLLDVNDQLIREQVLKFKFALKYGSVAL